jgi:hypothetical protein
MSSSRIGGIACFRFIAASRYGASASSFRRSRSSARSLNSGITSAANSSSESQMWSWRFFPPCWMKIT